MTSADPTFEGVYGTYSITAADRQEVRFYRIALLITGLSLAAGVLQCCSPVCSGQDRLERCRWD